MNVHPFHSKRVAGYRRGYGVLVSAGAILLLSLSGFETAAQTTPSNAASGSAQKPDAIAFLLRNPTALPKEVDLAVATDFDLVINGVRSGSIKAAPGTRLKVLGLRPGFVHVSFNTSAKWVPIAATDLAARASAAMQASVGQAPAAAVAGGAPAVQPAGATPAETAPVTNGAFRRPISPSQPMWLIHIDTWNYPDPQKIIDLIPKDIRPWVVMNISLSINHDEKTGNWKTCEYGYETAKSWLRTCAENRMWAMIQPSSGGYSHFPDNDMPFYEKLYQEYPNLIGFNYCEQFWGFDSRTDGRSPAWAVRIDHFAKLLEVSHKYGGYLVVSWCGGRWAAAINPIAMLKRNRSFEKACEKYAANYILCEKYTSSSRFLEIESLALGAWLSGYSGQYGIRFDHGGWSGAGGRREDKFPTATGAIPQIEHAMLTGETVTDGPELIWVQCFRELPRGRTQDGFTTREWGTYPQFDNISVDVFRKILDGTIRIPSRREVIDRTKLMVVNDVKSGSDEDKYSTPQTLFEGLYRMDDDGNWDDNKSWFKKTGRYPSIPIAFKLADADAKSFSIQLKKSDYEKRWKTPAEKTAELDKLFPQEYTGDIFAGRLENGWVTYNPFKTGQTAKGAIPLKYNTCTGVELAYSPYGAGVMKEYPNKLTFYLTNYDAADPALKTDTVRIHGSSVEPTYTFADRGSHPASKVTKDWSGGVLTLTVEHNGPLDLTVNCAGKATARLSTFTKAVLAPPNPPPVYRGPRQYEAECFDFRNIAENVTNGINKDVRNYAGQGYLNFGAGATASVRDTVTVPQAGTYRLETRYCVADADINGIDLYVNGSRVATPVFTKTASLGEWGIQKLNVPLKAGENTIEFRAKSGLGSPFYLDNIVISPST